MEKIKEMKHEASEEAIKEELSGLESVRRFGEIMSEVLEEMKSHVISCSKCEAKYKDFVEFGRLQYRGLARTLKFAGTKKTENVASINPDFLGLYDH